ncbi:uncharacterized protein [Pyrus communis]|uniref:uncharacterized protein n=1 Tax=Pyrus communis TaxID=23211 RepID=UPI0035C21315
MNLIGTPAELEEIAAHLKSKIEMKDLGKTRYYLGLEIEHYSDGILVHQSNYTQKVLRCFNEDKVKLSSTPMVVRTLDAKRNPFCPKEDEEEILEPEIPYLSVIGLKEVMGHIRSTNGLTSVVDFPTMIFEDNAACIDQLKKGYIKGDNTKHIAPKFFYLHQQHQHQNIKVKQIHSQDNLADIFTKSLPESTFQKLVQGIGMRKLSELNRL